MTALACHSRAYRVPKRGYTLDECEDAFAVDDAAGRFAIADGATESAESGLWADLLVKAFVQGAVAPGWPDWVSPLQGRWAELIDQPAADAMPWFLETRYRDGAFATFLGVTFTSGKWHALAVGDSCVFQVRGGELIARFPLAHSVQFDSTPALIGSRHPPDDDLARLAIRHEGDWQAGDRLYLMTDALSRWFLSVVEEGGMPWLHLNLVASKTPEIFAEWVAQLREDRKLKNDDTTLVMVSL